MKKFLLLFGWLLLTMLPRQIQAQNLPDLVIVAPFSLPTAVFAGEAYPMSANIRVNGNPGVGAQFTCIGYYFSSDAIWDANDAYLGASCQGLLFAGQSGRTIITGTIPPLVSPGKYYLVLVADPLNAERESDETNNVVSFPVLVSAGAAPLPDLTLLRPSLSFSTVPAGGTTGAFSFIANQGSGAVSGYEVGFYLSTDTIFSGSTDVFMGQITGGSLSGSSNGSVGTFTIFSAPVLPVPKSTAPGNYYLLMVIDPRNLIAESDETNNSRALRLVVTGGVVTAATNAANDAVQVYPNPVSRGTNLTLQLSAVAAETELTLLDGLGRIVARQTLRAGQTEATFATASLPAGFYTLRLTGLNRYNVRRVLVK